MKNNISDIRDNLEITQQELADAIGVSRQSISSIEREVHDPSLRIANDIANFLEYPLEVVFNLTKEVKDTRPQTDQFIGAMIAGIRALGILDELINELFPKDDKEEK